jgi:hypothetical protein
MLHRYFGITRMVSVEFSQKIRKRVHFNRPFGSIDLLIDEIGNVIPDLSKDRKHLLWLDYDSRLLAYHLRDIAQAATHLSPGSLLLITMDVEPPGDKLSKPAAWKQYFLREAGDYLSPQLPISDFAQSKLTAVVGKVLSNCIESVVKARKDIKWLPLFCFSYADGHEMLTVGGMIVAPDDERRIQSSGIYDAVYYRSDFAKPFRIRVPNLTKKERVLLDAEIPKAVNWAPEAFELSPKDVEAYQQIYRFMPVYAELYL